jgi:mRNA interferase MazF
MKIRPVLVLTGPIGAVPEVLVAYVSSVVPPALLPSDLVIDPASPAHAVTNLKTVSVLRLHKLATIHRRSVVRYLGKVSPATAADIALKLRSLLGL